MAKMYDGNGAEIPYLQISGDETNAVTYDADHVYAAIGPSAPSFIWRLRRWAAYTLLGR